MCELAVHKHFFVPAALKLVQLYIGCASVQIQPLAESVLDPSQAQQVSELLERYSTLFASMSSRLSCLNTAGASVTRMSNDSGISHAGHAPSDTTALLERYSEALFKMVEEKLNVLDRRDDGGDSVKSTVPLSYS